MMEFKKNFGKKSKCKKAFTVAEVLIAIAVIGVIAAFTIPALIKNYKEKTINTTKAKTELEIKNAAGLVYANGGMKGSTTEAFMQKFNKYAKLAKICDSYHLADCFPSEISLNGETVSVNDLKTPRALGQNYTNDDNMAGVFIDGTSFIMSFDPKCKIEKDLTSCMHMIVSLGGIPNNEVGSGIITHNAKVKTYWTTGDLESMGVLLCIR